MENKEINALMEKIHDLLPQVAAEGEIKRFKQVAEILEGKRGPTIIGLLGICKKCGKKWRILLKQCLAKLMKNTIK